MDTPWIHPGHIRATSSETTWAHASSIRRTLGASWIVTQHDLAATPWSVPGDILDTPWIHGGYTVDTHWIKPGYTVNARRNGARPGYTLDTPWIHHGYTTGAPSETPRVHRGYTTNAPWVHHVHILDSPWVSRGHAKELGALWRQPGYTMDTRWIHSRYDNASETSRITYWIRTGYTMDTTLAQPCILHTLNTSWIHRTRKTGRGALCIHPGYILDAPWIHEGTV
jgi:hypothetical protein